jgi:hypothetical protein
MLESNPRDQKGGAGNKRVGRESNRRPKALKNMGLQSQGQKPSPHRQRQMMLTMDKVHHPNGQIAIWLPGRPFCGTLRIFGI